MPYSTKVTVLQAVSPHSASLKSLQASTNKKKRQEGENLGERLNRSSHTPVTLVPGCASACLFYLIHPRRATKVPKKDGFIPELSRSGFTFCTRFEDALNWLHPSSRPAQTSIFSRV